MKLLKAITIGDAYGRPFEFATQEFIQANNNLIYVNRKEEDGEPVGIYTDDSQMSLAIAEHLIDDQPISQGRFIRYFMDAYKRDPRKGYSRRLISLLTLDTPVDFAKAMTDMEPRNSNGSVMRVLPIGMQPELWRVKQAAIIQAVTTHAHIECINAAVVLALTAHYFYYNLNVDYYPWMSVQVGNGVFREVYDSYSLGSSVPMPCDAMKTVAFCIKNVLFNNNFSDILREAVEIGGDVDSTAAISLGLAALANKVEDLPDDLYTNLENGKFGRDYIDNLDNLLYNKFKVNDN